MLQGLNDAALNSAYGAQASDNLTYLRNPIWWAGMVTSAWLIIYLLVHNLTCILFFAVVVAGESLSALLRS